MASTTSRDTVRYIGIDFGTSTSVLCYRDYRGGETFSDVQTPAIDPYSHRHLVPTVIYDEPGGKRVHGALAEQKAVAKPQHARREFKMDLVSPDAAKRHRAEELLDDFFRFLHARYRQTQQETAEYPVAGEHTWISFPAKWPDTVRQRTVEAARKAGFPDVRGSDEPSAAMQAVVLTRNAQTDALVQRGVIQPGVPLNVLLLDMGAGTTDLMLYRYRPGRPEQEVLASWPPVDNPGTFGGREVDALFTRYLHRQLTTQARTLSATRLDHLLAQQAIDIRAWKEDVSRQLVTEARAEGRLPFLVGQASLEPALDVDAIASLTRDGVGRELTEYLPRLPVLVNELIAQASAQGEIRDGDDVDFVVLTGGHSQWYFVREILAGRWVTGLPGSPGSGSGVKLGRIAEEPDRIVEPQYPQETVARGLTMMGAPVKITKRATNNAWLRLQVSISDAVDVPMVTMGERLPVLGKFAFRRFPAKYRPDDSVQVEWTPLFGTVPSTARPFDAQTVHLQVTDWIEAMAVRMAKWLGKEVEDTAEVSFEVSVDETEHLTAIGMLKGGDGFDDVKFFAVNRSDPSASEQAGLKQRHEEQRALVAPVSA